MATRYVLRNSPLGQFYFTLKAGNGETILTSERYITKAGALGGIDSVKVNSPIDARYEKKTTTNGSPMFNLKASNGQIIGTSESYSSTAARDGGIGSVKVNGPIGTLDDQT